jgi:hypothetical protein
MKFCYCCWVLTKVKDITPHKDLPNFLKKGRCLKEKNKNKIPKILWKMGDPQRNINALQFLRSQI